MPKHRPAHESTPTWHLLCAGEGLPLRMQTPETRDWHPMERDYILNDMENARQWEVWKATHISGYVAGETAKGAWTRRVTDECKAEMATVSTFLSFADWSSHMEEKWSDEGYYPMGMLDEENDQDDCDEIAIDEPEELSTEQMLQYIEEQFMYYPPCWRTTRMT